MVRCFGMRLAGDLIDELDERGRRIVGDTLLVLFNGHHEDLAFTLPAPREGQRWVRLMDTARAEELARSNRELEEVAYIASHDLQAPQRHITGFAQLVAKRYTGKLDPETDDFIGRITAGTERMQNLIQALLAYSRAGSRLDIHLRFGACDLRDQRYIFRSPEKHIFCGLIRSRSAIP